MTDKVLNEYYNKHKDTYMSLAKNCSSVPEILLKLEIYGKRWSQWDWALLFSSVINCMFMNAMFPTDKTENIYLYQDIIETIDNSDMLDKVITNKQVILNIIYVINGNTRFITRNLKIELCTLLAHVFKKFPTMWNVSWMYAKFKDAASKKWQKYHRLKSSVYTKTSNCNDPYYSSKQYYKDFLRLYLLREIKTDEEKD